MQVLCSVHIFNLQEQCSIIFISSRNNTFMYIKEKGENSWKQFYASLSVAKVFSGMQRKKKKKGKKKSNKKLTLQ